MLRRLAGAVTVALAVAACSLPGEAGPAPSQTGTPSATSASSTSPSSSTGEGRRALDSSLVADLEEVLRADDRAEVSLALAPIGSHERPRVLGDAPSLIAWSTIKVPLALAVLGSGTEAMADIDAALTASDNAAADRLWESLGTPQEAAGAVESQLRRGGDARTQVPSAVTVPGYSAFGQSTWRLIDQAAFTAALPCLNGSSPVTEAMGRVVEGQRWGLGVIEGTRFKGGWGPTPEGYVVRQLGILPGAKGGTAAAVQVRTGTHEQGTAIMDEVAAVLDRHRKALPNGSC
ncbi:hypothetical protein [Janibacter alittae]|uniref:Beta-lactamase class A n=1 Tax=Janibacter alittae TaxID=3115209 RepID=A0ABZ2MHH5_9MICO